MEPERKGDGEMTNNNGEPTMDFSQLVTDHFGGLTKSEKRIANFLRKNLNEAAFLAASEIADHLDISEATVVRFARSLGFSSYPALRVNIQTSLRQRVTHSSRIKSRLEDMRSSADIFERLAASEIDYLSQALETVNREQMERAVDFLRERKRVFVFGTGPSLSLVDLLEIRLKRFGRDVFPLRSSGREMLEPLLSLGPNDLMIVICFFSINPSLRLVLEYANEVRCPVIMITDTLDTLVGEKADVVLAASRGPVSEFHSLVVPMTIINALLLSLANQEQEVIMPVLDRLDLLRDKLKTFNAREE
jgi:DNA-binding MurR/RpiR family transcriptional regulator